MATKRGTLSLAGYARESAPAPVERPPQAPPTASPIALQEDEPTVGVMCRVPRSLHRAMRQLALDRGTTMQALILAEMKRLTASKRDS